MAYASVAMDDVQPDLTYAHEHTIGSKRSGPYETIFSQDTRYSKVPITAEHSISETITAQHSQRPPWIPYTLRWPFLTLMTAVSLGLCALTAALIVYSRRNHGLGNDDGSNSLLFAWRFTPTIVAVIYAHLITMVFNDFRRTEPFARMAQGPTSAKSSVLQAPGAWWKMLAQAFSRKNKGVINWPLANATIAFVLASLAISSMSSTFLTRRNTAISRSVPLQKRTLSTSAPMRFKASPDVFLSTTGTLIYNLSVNPWTVGEYTVLPFWPEDSDLTAMRGGGEHNEMQIWEATTSVFRTEYQCSTMDATISLNQTKSFSAFGQRVVKPPQYTTVLVNGTSKMDTTVLVSDNGCRYQIDMAPTLMANIADSVVWGRAEDSLYDIGMTFDDMIARNTTQAYVYVPGNYTYDLDLSDGPRSPVLRHNRSADCVDKDIIHISTELVSSDGNSFRSDYTQKAWMCTLEISTADVPVTYSLSKTGPEVAFDRDEFAKKQSPVGNHILNGSDVRQLLHQSKWLSYLNPAHFLTDRSALLLSAEYQYDFGSMLSDNEIPRKAQSTMETFFAALLQSSVLTSDTWETQAVLGKNTLITTRVEVFEGTATAMAILFGICALLLAALAWQCTAHRRSLNLHCNPSTTEGVTDLVTLGQWDRASWKPLFIASTNETEKFLQSKTYHTSPKLQEHVRNPNEKAFDATQGVQTNTSVHDWKPTTLRIPSLMSLAVYLIILVIGISILYDFATGNRIYQNFFVNRVEFGEIAGHVARLTPFSIVPTLMAVLLRMWWDGMQQKFCQLQPFVAMTRPKGTQWKDGPGMHYSTTNWIKSSLRAIRNGHWLLTFVIIGNILCQVFIITASALFTVETGYISTKTLLQTSTELRRLPFIREFDGSFVVNSDAPRAEDWSESDDKSSFSSADLERIFPLEGVEGDYSLYWTGDSTWLYSATNQLVQGGDEPGWSKDGWMFTPVELPPTTENETISVDTQAVKARAVCSSTSKGYDVTNQDSWLLRYDLTDKEIWNTSANPPDIKTGYYIGNFTSYSTPFQYGLTLFPFCANATGTVMRGAMWNDWSGDQPGRFPYRFSRWPFNFVRNHQVRSGCVLSGGGRKPFCSARIETIHETATWIEGAARSDFLTRDNLTNTISSSEYDERIFPLTFCEASYPIPTRLNLSMFTEIPRFQSVSCEPVIEIASARATVSRDGSVDSFQLLEDPKPFDEPWKDVFVSYTHNSSDAGYTPDTESAVDRNVSSSYGISFLSSLLRAPQIGFDKKSDEDAEWTFDNLYPDAINGNSSAYFIRDGHTGMDLMSYCMYSLADKNTSALLTNTTLYSELVDRTFRTFFAHFAAGDANSTTRRVYQKIGDKMPDFGRKVVYDTKSGLLKQEDPETYPPRTTNTNVDAQVNRRVQLLKMNQVATWLSFGILIFLLLITIVILFLHRRFLSPLHRNVECMADIMLLVAGSDHLLALVEERGVETLREDESLLVRLGWFRSENGQLRWGIEVLNSGDANRVMDVVWEQGNGSRSQSKWQRASTGLSNLKWERASTGFSSLTLSSKKKA